MNEATDIKCRCQHCSGKIAFDASGWKPGERRMVKCPHCGLDTVLFDPATVGSDELGRTGGVVVQITGGVSPLGVASVCLGLVACLGCWVPVLGLVAIPMAGIGLLLAAIGFIVDRKSNRSFLVAGVIVCIVAVVTTLVVSELTALGVRHEMQRIAREKQVREAAAAQAREEAHQRWIEARNKAIARVGSEVASLRSTLTNQMAVLREAQGSFVQVQAGSDAFMAAKPWLTNEVYAKLLKDHKRQKELVPVQSQTIAFVQNEANQPYQPQTQELLGYRFGGYPVYQTKGMTYEDWQVQHVAKLNHLQDLQNELKGMYARIQADEDTMAQIESSVSEFQRNKVNSAQGTVNAAEAQVNQTEGRIDADNNSLRNPDLLVPPFKPRKAPESGTSASPKGIIASRSASGTGFFITEDGYLISNNHVVKDAVKVSLCTSAGLIDAKIVQVDADNDLALLKAEGKFSPLPIVESGAMKLGGTVATIGFPDIVMQGFAPKLAKGEIASLSGMADDPRYFQISVPVQPGNSGGALVDERGNVIGIVSAKLNPRVALAVSGALPENVNYAVKSSFLLSFLESVPDVANKLKAPVTADRKFEDVVKSAQDAAVLVLVY